MKILIIGSGGREHTIAWKCSKSPLADKIYIAPGNPGTKELGTNVDIQVDDVKAIKDYVQRENIDLVIIGPELPLSLGIVNELEKLNVKVFGPSKEAAMIEASKSFAKEIMIEAGVPTAGFKTFSDKQSLLTHIEQHGAPIVLKADGLAAGKGVFVCSSEVEAKEAAEKLFTAFKSKTVIAEDFLKGPEVSYIVATNGKLIFPLQPAHDYKRIGEGDTGLNTGGMGCVSPTPRITKEQDDEILNTIIRPVLNKMKEKGINFSGFLYAGLLIDEKKGLQVIEFNARLGDPETQVILPCLKTDFLEVILSLLDDKEVPEPEWLEESAVCVVLASKGYPESSSKGDDISGLELARETSNSFIFHAGTKESSSNQGIQTNGGRVLSVVGLGLGTDEARRIAYKAASHIQFDGMQLRRDIAKV